MIRIAAITGAVVAALAGGGAYLHLSDSPEAVAPTDLPAAGCSSCDARKQGLAEKRAQRDGEGQ